ncbi:LysR family transcriptional regulator [Mesorhizobium sp. M0088]|uniref:LysR family transcriptional regulator n=1 Tax=Mesorhizobium sp. M0088 TaxID=2956873 RepID=UPI0033376538
MERLPPLNAIKAFEVAARAGSFTLAASELGVSSAAVSQQIRNLENWFGKQLFVRTGNRIALTDAGHAIYPQTAKALGDIAAIGQRMLEGGMRTRLSSACRSRWPNCGWRRGWPRSSMPSRRWPSMSVSRTIRST